MTETSHNIVAGGENSELKWKNLGDGVAAAKTANKKILVDVYTDWCGWCKKMDKEVYTDGGMQKYLNEKFVLVKLNAESDKKHTYNGGEYSEIEIAQMFGITGYPTTVFLMPNGEPITALPGYVKAEKFLKVLKYIGDDYYEKMKFGEFLEKFGR